MLTVDVEEYFQAETFSRIVPRTRWDRMPARVARSTGRIRDILGERGVRATFFVLGWIARRYPDLVRSLHRDGHEIASHGWDHRMLTRMAPERFREDVRRSKRILEDIVGEEVSGYRAPTFSIVERTAWAHDILADEGYGYSSSVFPVRHDRYGWPEFGRLPRAVAGPEGNRLLEIPMSVARFARLGIPFGGGGYLRAMPVTLTAWLLRRNRRLGLPVVVYIHPWEIDPEQPRIRISRPAHVRHYLGIEGAERKLCRLLDTFRFDTMKRYLERKAEREKGGDRFRSAS